jgi:protein-S-isoprenylcysteine O-methyltransferase Ste14
VTKAAKTTLNLVLIVALAYVFGRWQTPALRSLFNLSVGMRVSVVLWILFSVYWSIAAKNSAKTQSSESVWSRRLHLFLVNAALLLLILPVPGLTYRFLPASNVLAGAGLLFQAASILFAIWSRRSLGSNWSGEVRIAAEHQLIRSGPYRFIRHPIYTGLLGMYCGTMIISGQIHAPLALVLALIAYWRKIRLEESALGQTFGADYDSYRRETWALIPGLV